MFRAHITGQEFTSATKISLNLRFDSVRSTFQIDGVYDPNNSFHVRSFLPFAYRKVEIFANDELVLTGVATSVSFTDSKDRQLTSISGYSLPGVLEDCTIPLQAYPLETNGKTIRQIVQTIVSDTDYNLNVVTSGGEVDRLSNTELGLDTLESESVEESSDTTLETTSSSPQTTVQRYLSDILASKNLLLSHDENGNVLITRANANTRNVIAFQNQDILSVNLRCSGESMHRTLTVVKQASFEEEEGSEFTIENPYITEFTTEINATNPYVPNFRPTVQVQKSGGSETTATAARNLLGNELKNIAFTIQLNRWTFPNGQILRPNRTISIPANRLVYLPRVTNLFIESVTFNGTPEEQTATLSCVVPETYNNLTPTNIFR